jgi:predicted SAM-dependent methyltransferase
VWFDYNVEFGCEMGVKRIREAPRITKPFSDESWARLDALGMSLLQPLLFLECLLLTGFLAMRIANGTPVHVNAPGAIFAGMLGVAAMAVQNAVGQISLGAVSTTAMTANVARFALDVEKPLPIPNSVFDAIYGSEVIEHIEREEAKRFLHQAYRVLKPGGVVRLTTPDLKAVCEIYLGINDQTSLEDQKSTWLEPEFSRDYWINKFFRGWGHQWIWDFESLTELIRSSGFDRVERVQPQVTKSGMPELENLETRYGVPAPKHCWATSMILEATR